LDSLSPNPLGLYGSCPTGSGTHEPACTISIAPGYPCLPPTSVRLDFFPPPAVGDAPRETPQLSPFSVTSYDSYTARVMVVDGNLSSPPPGAFGSLLTLRSGHPAHASPLNSRSPRFLLNSCSVNTILRPLGHQFSFKLHVWVEVVWARHLQVTAQSLLLPAYTFLANVFTPDCPTLWLAPTGSVIFPLPPLT